MRHLGLGAGGLRTWDVFPGCPWSSGYFPKWERRTQGRDKGWRPWRGEDAGANVLRRTRGNQMRWVWELPARSVAAVSKSRQLAGLLSYFRVTQTTALVLSARGHHPRHWTLSPACGSAHMCAHSHTLPGPLRTAVVLKTVKTGRIEQEAKRWSRSRFFLLSCSPVRSGLSTNRKGKEAI